MTVYIYPNLKKQFSLECTKQVIQKLSEMGCNVIASEALDVGELGKCLEIMDQNDAVAVCDVIITIGGDGTILRIASLAAKYRKKLLGINCGRLGFMASLEKDELDDLSKLLTSEYKTESRMMLDVVIEHPDSTFTTVTALNDIVITHGFNYYINDFTVLADGTTVSSLRADGLIFSTPTGASAYSLSAGGPLIEPTMDCIEFTQICPHSLFARTMLFAPNKLIEVKYRADGTIGVSADGASPIPVTKSDRIYIRKSSLRLDLIDIRGDNFFKSIGAKLMQPAKEI